MKKAFIFLLLCVLMTFILVSCSEVLDEYRYNPSNNQSQDGGGNGNGQQGDSEVKEIDLSKITDKQWINISSDVEYALINMDDAKLYSFELESQSRDISRGNGNSNFINTNGKNLLIPNSKGQNRGMGSDLGCDEEDRIRIFTIDIANPKGTEDLSIVANEADFSPDVCAEWNEREALQAVQGFKREQFYHVNFNTPTFKNLDRSRIFMVIQDQGGANMGGVNWGIVTKGKGYTAGSFDRKTNPSMYMYDFSDTPFVNIYHSLERYFTEDRWEQYADYTQRRNAVSTVLILNPVSLKQDEFVEVGPKDRIFSISPASGASEDASYVIETKDCDLREMVQLTDREGKDYGFAYCMDINAENKCYYVEKLTEEVFFDIDYTRDEGSIKIRYANESDSVDNLISLSSASYEFEEEITFSDENREYYNLFSFIGEDDFIPTDMLVSISLLDEYGNPADNLYSEYYFSSAHSNGVGSSGRGYDNEPCLDFKVSTRDILKTLKIRLYAENNQTVNLRILITDGTGSFKVGEYSSFEKIYSAKEDVSDLVDKSFIIDFDTGNLQTIEKNDIFWYVMTMEDYNADETLATGASHLPPLIESLGVVVDRTYFYPTGSKNLMSFKFQIDSSGKTEEDVSLMVVYVKYTGDGTADLSKLKPSDFTELASQELVFYKSRNY